MLIKARLKWMGHVRRMPDHRYPKMILMADLQRGKRNFAKPAQRWKDLAKMDMQKLNINPTTWWASSGPEQRNSWRHTIHQNIEKWEDARTKAQQLKRVKRKKKEAEQERMKKVEGKVCEHKCEVPGCNSSFTQRSAMFRHMVQRHRKHERVLTCPTCFRTCLNQSGLTRHRTYCRGPKPNSRRPANAKLS